MCRNIQISKFSASSASNSRPDPSHRKPNRNVSLFYNQDHSSSHFTDTNFQASHLARDPSNSKVRPRANKSNFTTRITNNTHNTQRHSVCNSLTVNPKSQTKRSILKNPGKTCRKLQQVLDSNFKLKASQVKDLKSPYLKKENMNVQSFRSLHKQQKKQQDYPNKHRHRNGYRSINHSQSKFLPMVDSKKQFLNPNQHRKQQKSFTHFLNSNKRKQIRPVAPKYTKKPINKSNRDARFISLTDNNMNHFHFKLRGGVSKICGSIPKYPNPKEIKEKGVFREYERRKNLKSIRLHGDTIRLDPRLDPQTRVNVRTEAVSSSIGVTRSLQAETEKTRRNPLPQFTTEFGVRSVSTRTL